MAEKSQNSSSSWLPFAGGMILGSTIGCVGGAWAGDLIVPRVPSPEKREALIDKVGHESLMAVGGTLAGMLLGAAGTFLAQKRAESRLRGEQRRLVERKLAIASIKISSESGFPKLEPMRAKDPLLSNVFSELMEDGPKTRIFLAAKSAPIWAPMDPKKPTEPPQRIGLLELPERDLKTLMGNVLNFLRPEHSDALLALCPERFELHPMIVTIRKDESEGGHHRMHKFPAVMIESLARIIDADNVNLVEHRDPKGQQGVRFEVRGEAKKWLEGWATNTAHQKLIIFDALQAALAIKYGNFDARGIVLPKEGSLFPFRLAVCRIDVAVPRETRWEEITKGLIKRLDDVQAFVNRADAPEQLAVQLLRSLETRELLQLCTALMDVALCAEDPGKKADILERCQRQLSSMTSNDMLKTCLVDQVGKALKRSH